MNIGKYIFAQVIDFIPRYQFDKLVKKYKGDWHAKDLTCYNQLLHLLFGQTTGCDSIRDICLCLEAHGSSIYHIGIRKSVNQSNLCRANEKRDYRIYEELGMYLIGIVRPMYSNTKVAEITIDNVLYALDSTTISTSIVLAAWATLIRISALERVDLRDLITKPKDSIIQNQNVKELTFFDEF